MDKYIEERIKNEVNYILKHKSTVRDLANVFKVSKSTVHKDLHERLKEINVELFIDVDKIFKNHIETRHIKGGESTKQKYLNR